MHLPGNKNYRGDNTVESRLVQKKMGNINGLNIPNTSTYNKNVSTELHKRFLQVPTWKDWAGNPIILKTKWTYPQEEGFLPPAQLHSIGLGSRGEGVRVERTQRHRRPGGRIKSCCSQKWAQVECSVLWPQETNWRNDLGPLFPELLELCYVTGLRSFFLGGGIGEED